MREMFLHDMIRIKSRIDWKSNIGKSVKFIYDDIKGEVEIVDYDGVNVSIRYLDKPIYKINRGHFIKCTLGKYLDKCSDTFKYSIQQTIKDDKRNITIIDKEYRNKIVKSGYTYKQKWYKYICSKCGNKAWIIESRITGSGGCNACCTGRKTPTLGINTIWDKARWMVALGVSEEDAKTHTRSSEDKIIVVCPVCKITKKIIIGDMYKRHSIGCKCNKINSIQEVNLGG